MSRRASKKVRRGGADVERGGVGVEQGGADAGRAFYVYCVGEGAALAPLFEEALPDAIEEGAGLEAVEVEGLAAVVSRVPLEVYGEGALAARLSDAAWTATRALRHERVAEHFARRAAVAPLRFGSIYLRREGVAAMLAERAAQLREVIARLEGREEWGVNVYVERALLREGVTRLSERLREMVGRAEGSTPGQAYLLRKKVEGLRDEEARAETRRVAQEVEARLKGASDGAVRLRVMKDEAAEQGELAARLAFLVRRDGFERFRDEAERLAAEYTQLGFRFELTGPWPAYNFATVVEEGEKEARG